jgi:hypothetical protein
LVHSSGVFCFPRADGAQLRCLGNGMQHEIPSVGHHVAADRKLTPLNAGVPTQN